MATSWLLVLAISFLVLYLFSCFSPRIKYNVKYVGYLMIICLMAFLIIVYSVVRWKRSHENFQFITRLAKLFRVKQFLGLDYFIDGEEILNAVESPRIFVSNHQSSLDMLGMSLIWPRRTTVLVKRSLRFVPVFGLAAWLSKTVFIDRVRKEKAKTVMEKTIKQIKNDKVSHRVDPLVIVCLKLRKLLYLLEIIVVGLSLILMIAHMLVTPTQLTFSLTDKVFS